MKFDSFYKTILTEGRKAAGEPENKLNRTKNIAQAIQKIRTLYHVSSVGSLQSILRPGFIESKNLLGYSNNENLDFIGHYYTEILRNIPVTIVPDKKMIAPTRVESSGGHVEDQGADISEFNAASNYLELYKHREGGKDRLKEIPDNVKGLVYAYIYSDSDNNKEIIQKHVEILIKKLKDESTEFVKNVEEYVNFCKDKLEKEEEKESKVISARHGSDTKDLQSEIDKIQKQIDNFDEDDNSPKALKAYNDLTDQLSDLVKQRDSKSSSKKLNDIGVKGNSAAMDQISQRLKNAEKILGLLHSKIHVPKVEDEDEPSGIDTSDKINTKHELDVSHPEFENLIRPRLVSKANESLVKTLLAMFASAVNVYGSNPITDTRKDLMTHPKAPHGEKGKDTILPIPSLPTLTAKGGDYPKFRKELLKLFRIERKVDKTFKLNALNLTKIVTMHKDKFTKIPDDLIKKGTSVDKIYATVYENPIYIALMIFDAITFPKLPTSKELERGGDRYEKFYEFLILTLAGLSKTHAALK